MGGIDVLGVGRIDTLGISQQLQQICNNAPWAKENLTALPEPEKIHKAIILLKHVLFPEISNKTHDEATRELEEFIQIMRFEICRSMKINADCQEMSDPERMNKTEQILSDYVNSLPKILELLFTDLEAIYHGDPATNSYKEIVLSYLSFDAIVIYRLAHPLYEAGVPIIPRVMSEYAHKITGIDINPGAKIGSHFFIDHGTGVVIGETVEIGNNVKIYQGVTLGALSLEEGRELNGVKRHPSIEDNVVIYANATILGGETVIGEGSIIGGGTFITRSVEANTQVVLDMKQLPIKSRKK